MLNGYGPPSTCACPCDAVRCNHVKTFINYAQIRYLKKIKMECNPQSSTIHSHIQIHQENIYKQIHMVRPWETAAETCSRTLRHPPSRTHQLSVLLPWSQATKSAAGIENWWNVTSSPLIFLHFERVSDTIGVCRVISLKGPPARGQGWSFICYVKLSHSGRKKIVVPYPGYCFSMQAVLHCITA